MASSYYRLQTIGRLGDAQKQKASQRGILREKAEKEARIESKAKKIRRVHAEIQEAWEDFCI
jgi:hypothetical protein